MDFPCFVCEKIFTRSQDRSAHLRLKNDHLHQEYVRGQAASLTARFSEAIQVATTNIRSSYPLVLQPLSVQSNDVDADDLPSSWDMNTEDADSLSDQEGSIISSQEEPAVEENEINAHILATAFGDASSALEGLELDDNEVRFDFLPAPVLDADAGEGEAAPAPNIPAQRRPHLGRVLDDDDEEPHTWRWHNSAGRIYRHEDSVFQRWKRIFADKQENSGEGYQPFHSRLEWEVSQWAVMNKIGQGSLNRLLQIPQVTF